MENVKICFEDSKSMGGLRLKGVKNKSGSNAPLISIITSTLNAAKHLPYTIQSIREQTYKNIEWIIIDGGSQDGTIELICNHEDVIDYWLSESDSGIYDAWNKACKEIRGDWVLFIGAGDELATCNVLEEVSVILGSAYPKHELVYGKVQFICPINRTFLKEVGQPWHQMKGRWEFNRPALPAHPGVFHHSSVLNINKPFDDTLKIAADSKLLLQSILKREPLYIPIFIDKMPIDGVSAQFESFFEIINEITQIRKDLKIHPPLIHKLKEDVKFFVKLFIFKIIPVKYQSDILVFFRKIITMNSLS